ncbi:MAG: cupin domain-containing protein [Armatimonadetes bacterium]|nr:cupin domain-containing protein [Armatimonadota bacterium]
MRLERWQGAGPPDERDLLARLRAEGFDGYVWHDPPGAVYGDHAHDDQEIRWIVQGTLTISFADGTEVMLGPGDRLHVPAGAVHRALAGPEGARYVCAVAP